jgi:hypothetical protein
VCHYDAEQFVITRSPNSPGDKNYVREFTSVDEFGEYENES